MLIPRQFVFCIINIIRRMKWFIRNKMEIILVALVYLDEKYARYVIDVLN